MPDCGSLTWPADVASQGAFLYACHQSRVISMTRVQVGSSMPVASDAEEDSDVEWCRRWSCGRSISRSLAGVLLHAALWRVLTHHQGSAFRCFAALRCIDASCIMFDDFVQALADIHGADAASSTSSSLLPPPPSSSSPPLSSLRLNPCFLSSIAFLSPFSCLCHLSVTRHSSCPPWTDNEISRLFVNMQVGACPRSTCFLVT